MHFEENFSLKSLNTFGLTARARYFAEAGNTEELKAILTDPKSAGVTKMILGGGSNILFTRDFDGLIIHNNIGGISKLSEDTDSVLLQAGGGVIWHEFVLYAVEHGYSGIENLSLIPGTVGAAPMQNIGAYGVEIKDTFHSLVAVDLSNGESRTFNLEQCHFGYRDSVFKREEKGKYIIVSVIFRLRKNPVINTSYGAIEEQLKSMGIEKPGIKDVSNAVIAIRRSKLPDPKEIGNAGSFFKNPEIPMAQYEDLKRTFPDMVAYKIANDKMKLAAGWLIEQCGWKGKRVGNAGMHARQALVLVNYGGATGEELINHARNVQKSVKEKFGVEIEMEVNVW